MNKLLITLLLVGLVIGIFALPKPDQGRPTRGLHIDTLKPSDRRLTFF